MNRDQFGFRKNVASTAIIIILIVIALFAAILVVDPHFFDQFTGQSDQPSKNSDYGGQISATLPEKEIDHCDLVSSMDTCVTVTQWEYSWVPVYDGGNKIITNENGATTYSSTENIPGQFPGYLAMLHAYSADGVAGNIAIQCVQVVEPLVVPVDDKFSKTTYWYACLTPAIPTP